MLWAVVVAAKGAIPEHILESDFTETFINKCPIERNNITVSSEYSGCELSGISSSLSGSVFYSTSAVRIIVSNCTFTTCYTTSSSGGVFYISTASLDIKDCVFMNCSSSLSGGVLYQKSVSSSLSVTNSTADGCHCGSGGGVFRIDGGNATVKDGCLFRECYAERSSGSVISEAASSSSVFITFMNSRFLNCQSKGGGLGGSVFIHYGDWNLSHCEFESCESPYAGGAVYQFYDSSELVISDCLMKKCIARCTPDTSNGYVWTGAAVGLESGTTIIERTVFEACESFGSGGAIGTQSRSPGSLGTVLIRDCEMIGCKAGEYGGALYFEKSWFSLTLDRIVCFECYGSGTKGLSIYISSISEFTWTNLCIQGSGSLVYSVKNQPSSSDLNKCPTDPFTANVLLVRGTGKNNFALTSSFMYLFVHY